MRGGGSWQGKGSLESCWLSSHPNTADNTVTAFFHSHQQGTLQCTEVQFSVWYVGHLSLCVDSLDIMVKISDKFKKKKGGIFSNLVTDKVRAR
jgi:hypothetical protein